MLSSPGQALWVGQSQVNPFLEIRGAYDSNIYRTSDLEGVDSDFITVISPGIHYEYPTTKNPLFKAIADYRADIIFYTKNGDSEVDPDSQLNTTNHRLGGEVLFDLASGVFIKGGYTLNITSSPPDFRGDTRDDYDQHDLLAQLSYRFADRYKVELDYRGLFRRFDKNTVDDLNRNAFELIGFYQVRPKISILLGGSFVPIDRKEPFLDSTEYTLYTGGEYEATAKTKGILKVGAIARDFDKGFVEVDDLTNFYFSGEMINEYSDRLTWSLRLLREYNDTTVSNQTAESGVIYVSSGIGGRIDYTLASLPNMSTYSRLLFRDDDYTNDPEGRNDDRIQFGLGLDYKFYKYLIVGASYEYDNRNSNIPIYDFTEHIALLKIRGII
jgi:hypothetical protein